MYLLELRVKIDTGLNKFIFLFFGLVIYFFDKYRVEKNKNQEKLEKERELANEK
jgi:hypothetical protein